jgi:acyl-CoA hydrolase
VRTVSLDVLEAELSRLTVGSRVVVGGNFASPMAALGALDRALEEYHLYALNAQPGLPTRAGVVHETSFVGPGMRGSASLRYLPARLSLVPALFRTALGVDAVVVQCAPPRAGLLSLGTEVNELPAAIEEARRRGGIVVAQINEQMPYTYGDSQVNVADVDLAVEISEPLRSPGGRVVDDVSSAVGQGVAGLVPDGATLQLGIGAVPDAVLDALHDRRGLRIWSEMISDGVLALDDAGALDRDVEIVSSFVFGSPALYTWLHANPRVRMLRTESTNDPGLIARNPQMTSINTALEVDLFGQVNASRLNNRIYSGTGGQTDFIVGALHSPGGHAVIALRSWHPRADVSTVVAMLDEPVTSLQPSTVVTEQGRAVLWGRTAQEQAEALIENAAHPRVREELREEARYLGLAMSAPEPAERRPDAARTPDTLEASA